MDFADLQRERNLRIIAELQAENESDHPGEAPTLRELHARAIGEDFRRRMIQTELEDRLAHVEDVKLPRLEFFVDDRRDLQGALRFGTHRVRLASRQVALLVPLAEASPELMPMRTLRAIVSKRFGIEIASNRAGYKVLEALKRRPALSELFTEGRSGPPGGVGFAVRVEPWAV